MLPGHLCFFSNCTIFIERIVRNGQSLIEASWLPMTVAMEHTFFQVTSALLLSTRHISTCQPMSPCSNGRHGKVCSLAARKVGKWGSKVIKRLVEKTSGSSAVVAGFRRCSCGCGMAIQRWDINVLGNGGLLLMQDTMYTPCSEISVGQRSGGNIFCSMGPQSFHFGARVASSNGLLRPGKT